MQVILHSIVDVPYHNIMTTTNSLQAMLGIFKQYQFVIKDIANEDEVQFVGIEQRR